MKKSLLFLLATVCIAFTGFAQTPTNFNCNDCAGSNHDLFSELNAGKVVVISWVMPCGACLGPTLTASNVVQSYSSSNPGQVVLYVADDAANTNCTSLNSWVSSNGITANATFSNSLVDMGDYGSPGMPKIIVLGGGSTPTTFFNQNGSAAGNSTALQAAIDAALAVAVPEQISLVSSLQMAPNPATSNSTLTITMNEAAAMTVAIFNTLGEQVMSVSAGTLVAGENRIELNLEQLAAGTYYIQVAGAETRRTLRFTRVE